MKYWFVTENKGIVTLFSSEPKICLERLLVFANDEYLFVIKMYSFVGESKAEAN